MSGATSAVTTYRYSLPSERGEGWAIAFIDSTGCFTVLSDWGNYAYRWHANGWGPGDFRAFFVRCDDSYILGKIASRHKYQAERTLEAVKARIQEDLDEGILSPLQAQDELDALEDSEDLRSREAFAIWWTHSTKLVEPWNLAVYDAPQQAVAFVQKVMPRLRAAIREQLAQEAGSEVST